MKENKIIIKPQNIEPQKVFISGIPLDDYIKRMVAFQLEEQLKALDNRIK